MGLPPLRVAVNISSRQFQQPNFLSIVAQVLQETELEPHYLELEITETTVMQDASLTRTILRELQQIGIYVAMDDFGTGYSSLSYLKKFPFHTIKIDQYFIRDLSLDPQARAIVTAIIALGQGLGLTVVAEGVETQEQLYCLQSLQCEEMQGYLFSRPLSVEQATELLQTNFSLFSTSKDCGARPYSRGALEFPPALFGKEWGKD
jgi:EAL domain-containing protein (putative c-di-GMP-specific phosphodiesterase class I)